MVGMDILFLIDLQVLLKDVQVLLKDVQVVLQVDKTLKSGNVACGFESHGPSYGYVRLIALSDANELGGLPSQYPFRCIKGFFQIAQLFVFLVTGGLVFTVILATTYELSESILK